mmetsp:Transcript_120427/g.221469  ORF Transcript_120427/g.221469 Transcript_120427/m.221469 type:complete len:85 (-) Transcript_120427:37-291(-)
MWKKPAIHVVLRVWVGDDSEAAFEFVLSLAFATYRFEAFLVEYDSPRVAARLLICAAQQFMIFIFSPCSFRQASSGLKHMPVCG